MMSNEHEEDEFFLPSDDVWAAVADEMDDKPKRRKPFWIWFSFTAFLILMTGFLVFQSGEGIRFTSSVNELFSHVSHSTTDVIPETDEIALANESSSIIESFDFELVTWSPTRLSQPHRPLLSFLRMPLKASFLDFNQDPVMLDVSSRFVQGFTFRYSDSTLFTSLGLFASKNESISDENSTSLSDYIINSYASDAKLLSGEHSHESLQYGVDRYNDHSFSFKRLPLQTISPLIVPKKSISPSGISLIDHSHPRSGWILTLKGYGSLSDYSISNYSGFDDIAFSLKGQRSKGYQVTIEKNIHDRFSVYAGVGLDHAHFDANYLVSVNSDQLDIHTGPEGSSAYLWKVIPSLAGGLESTFLLSDLTSNLQSTDINLSLAHDFKTVAVPVGIKYFPVKSGKWKVGVGLGVEYSKRLITIDTGVNVLEANNASIELTQVAALDREDQPFRIHNVNGTAEAELNYQVSNKLSIGVNAAIAKPLSNVYQDANYTVNTYIVRAGVQVKYAIVSKGYEL